MTRKPPIPELVNQFYARMLQDPLLAPVFNAALGEREAAWAAHLARLADFWSSVMHGSGQYHGDPFSAHLRLRDLTPVMFDRWLDLFQATCREVLRPDEAAAFGERAVRIARSLSIGLFERLPAHKAPYQASGPPGG